MKKVVLSTFLLLILFINSSGQWYLKKYQVTDINFLSQSQLEESLLKSKKNLLIAGGIAGTGGVIFLIFKFIQPGMNEDPSDFEQLIGDEGVNEIGMITGIGIAIGGTIAGIAYLGRIGRIKSILNKNYPNTGSLRISPSLILNGYTRASCPGIALTYNF
jgi:hypothetical protein